MLGTLTFQGLPKHTGAMPKINKSVWKKWDAKTNDKVTASVNLSNLYLAVERGDVKIGRALK